MDAEFPPYIAMGTTGVKGITQDRLASGNYLASTGYLYLKARMDGGGRGVCAFRVTVNYHDPVNITDSSRFAVKGDEAGSTLVFRKKFDPVLNSTYFLDPETGAGYTFENFLRVLIFRMFPDPLNAVGEKDTELRDIVCYTVKVHSAKRWKTLYNYSRRNRINSGDILRLSFHYPPEPVYVLFTYISGNKFKGAVFNDYDEAKRSMNFSDIETAKSIVSRAVDIPPSALVDTQWTAS